jgi:hypothetical protein
MKAAVASGVAGAWYWMCVAALAAAAPQIPEPDPDPAPSNSQPAATHPRIVPPVSAPPPTASPARPSVPNPDPSPTVGQAPAGETSVATASPVFALNLRDGARLVGTPSESKGIVFDVPFGRVEIPLTMIRSVQFSADAKITRIQFHNGDRLTGAVRAETLKFRTPYGQMVVPMSAVEGLAATTDVKDPPIAAAAPPTDSPRPQYPATLPAPGQPGVAEDVFRRQIGIER